MTLFHRRQYDIAPLRQGSGGPCPKGWDHINLPRRMIAIAPAPVSRHERCAENDQKLMESTRFPNYRV